MKKDIILCGVGGQGILSIATIIGEAATAAGLNLKQAEVHGMSQRGGDVQSHLRLSDRPIYSDLIACGSADMIISMEPMESLRYLPYLAKTGCIVTGSRPVVNIPDYPPMEDVERELDSLRFRTAYGHRRRGQGHRQSAWGQHGVAGHGRASLQHTVGRTVDGGHRHSVRSQGRGRCGGQPEGVSGRHGG